MFQETDKKFQETDRLLTEKFQETDKQFKETHKKIRKLQQLFTSQWGKLVESLVEGDLITLLKEKGIGVKRIYDGLREIIKVRYKLLFSFIKVSLFLKGETFPYHSFVKHFKVAI